MGFTPRSTIYTLLFEGTDYEGLEVRMRATKLGALFDAGDLLAIGDRVGIDVAPTAAEMGQITSQFEDLADHLVSWNIEDEDGRPVPANLEGMKTQELPLIVRIVKAWQQAMGDVAPPLPNSSSSGRPPDALYMPMEALAGSLAS
jgi:hypothetical protein